MRTWTPVLVLVGCGGGFEVGDLDVVLVTAPGLAVERGFAEVDRVVASTCDDEVVEIDVGRTLDLAVPEPLPVPVGEYCGLGLAFADAPFDGSLRLDGPDLSLALDPGLAVRPVRVDYRGDTEG